MNKKFDRFKTATLVRGEMFRTGVRDGLTDPGNIIASAVVGTLEYAYTRDVDQALKKAGSTYAGKAISDGLTKLVKERKTIKEVIVRIEAERES